MWTPKTNMPRIFVLLSALTLAACSSNGGGDTPVTGGQGGTCIADQLQDRVGGPLLSSSAKPPAQGPFLRVSDLPHPQRILPPGAMITEDMRPDRLNVFIDAVGRITKITCG
ncbi:MAG: hypothetical protein K9H25_11265 [Rhodospirillum sp.]|nr:hypothetical protein [Rhodospirillum sp.]MCF8489867.1 hypothetical protein [Rhodospirillum sp.]MCF8499430.1 hypothetical protein [Rhodospirillum sp.]